MGFTNGQHDKPSTTGKVEKVKKGIGLKLTPDNHFHLQNKRLTNISAPIDDHDAVTKRFVSDLLKKKAATTYVNNELTKKANSSAHQLISFSSAHQLCYKRVCNPLNYRLNNTKWLIIKLVG